MKSLAGKIQKCRICQDRFAATATAHQPRPVFWLNTSAPILISGQAPGMRVYKSGIPFDDRSGDRLRQWMGITRDQFYDREFVSILPMAFCFPGYNAKGADLPPPPVCRRTWHDKVVNALPEPGLTLLVGGYAQQFFLGKASVTERVRNWQSAGDNIFPLPHPSWRNTGWIRKNPWFEADLLPALRSRIETLRSGNG